MKKVLLQKFGTSPPANGDTSFMKDRRPSVYNKEQNRKGWSKSNTLNIINISASDRVASASLLALPTFVGYSTSNSANSLISNSSSNGDAGSNSTISSKSSSEASDSRPHSPIVMLGGKNNTVANNSTINKKPKTKRNKSRSTLSKPRARNSVKMLSEANNKHLSACHRCGNVRKEKIECTKCIHVYCTRCHERMSQFYGIDAFIDGCPMCKRLCCCGENRSEECNREVHCYKKCPAAKLAAKFARQSDKMNLLYGQFNNKEKKQQQQKQKQQHSSPTSTSASETLRRMSTGSSGVLSNGFNFRSNSPFEMMVARGAIDRNVYNHINQMSPAEQLQHAATLLQMSPNARRRAQSEIIRVPSSRGGSRRNNNAELPAWYDPIELAKMQQRMLEEDDEDDLPSSITGRIGAYTLQERRKKLERYLEKRTRRIWDRNVRYQCRKNIAVNRLRVRGRFISREEELSLINAGFSPAMKDAEKTAKAVAWIESRRKERSMSSIN